jgi:hypothetical protein
MSLLFRIILGLIMIVIGTWVIIKTERILEMVGTNAWAEAKFGGWGGTRFMYKMIGLIVIFFGMQVMTNMFGAFINATLIKWLVPSTTL